MRIFKKRILVMSHMALGGGIKTFVINWLPLLNELDVAVDIINFSPSTKVGLDKLKDEFDNVGVIYQAAEILPELYKENNTFKNELTFFGSFVKNSIFEYIQQKMFYIALHKNLYDLVFINHSECIAPIVNILDFSSIFKTAIYTHCSHTFTPYKLFKGKYEDIATKYIVDSVNNHGKIDILTQKKNAFVEKTFKTNTLIIGMPLNVDEIYAYHEDKEKEDKILYLGRAYDTAKNITGFIDVVKKTGYKACLIVPETKDKDKIISMCEKANLENFEVHCKLSQEEKYKVSSSCKVCYVPSFTETFAYVVYENLNLMCVVVDKHEWSEELKETLPDIYLVDHDDAHNVLELAMNEYSYEKIVKQHENLVSYNEDVKRKWAEYLLSPNLNDVFDKKETKHAMLLSEKKTLDKVFETEKNVDFTQILTLYKNVDWSKINQTRYTTFYNLEKEKISDFDKQISDVDNLF